MNNKQKNTSILRRILTISIVACFIFFLLVFIFQYLQYKRIEDRLSTAYSTTYAQASDIYKLFSTFSEADNLFRLYTVDYSEESYNAYKDKLDTIKIFIDSIADLPIANNPLRHDRVDLELSQNLATEFASLKWDIDRLVMFANDSLVVLNESPQTTISQQTSTHNADSVINKILQDTAYLNILTDTLIREKGGLIKRIFNAKNDTVIAKNSHEVLSHEQIDIVHKNVEHLIKTNEKIYNNSLKSLQRTLLKMRDTERELVLSNYSLLHSLKDGIDRLKQLELDEVRKIEARDFALYRENFTRFGGQLIVAVIIMLLMIIFIVYYHYKTGSFEKKLYLEKEYAAKIAEEKTSILANVSHEVRTPINSLKGVIDILKTDNNTRSIDQEIIQAVDQDITVINSTLNDILSLSKLEADSLEIKYEHFSPHQLLEDIIGLHKYQAKTKGLRYNYNNNIDQNISIYSNIFRIKQIVSNLISNAIKYTPDGTIEIQADFVDSVDKQRLIVSVRDTGIGIDDNQKDQVFRKYYVADTKKRSGGFGLGLYISKILSEQIDGNISFSSKFGQGSIFTFDLPIDKKHIKTDNRKDYSVADLPEDLDIVVIDDNQISLFFIQQLFKTKKNVQVFHSSKQAWSHIQTNHVDIVITDLIMPEIDGWQLLQNIKSEERLSHIRIFVSTAEPMLLEGQSKRTYIFDGIIMKPFQENAVVKAILNV
ncbi:MAG TPA: ATP-binding protein [Sphingobacterium sp.]|nr:ATP-binding protein [Sphingobacterium sp.]